MEKQDMGDLQNTDYSWEVSNSIATRAGTTKGVCCPLFDAAHQNRYRVLTVKFLLLFMSFNSKLIFCNPDTA